MKTIHVYPDSPALTPAPGALFLLHGGIYPSLRFGPEWSGTAASPTVIRAAEGEKPVIHPDECPNRRVGILLNNVHHLTLEGLEVEGGTHGIGYESTREAGSLPLENVAIRDCVVHGIRGTHGICVYARNDLAPVKNLTISGCEVYDCQCGSSESVVLNGNIDGFLIEENLIHDNNNIGIDMIGFEGTAKCPDPAPGISPYAVDMARNGICRNNSVRNICTEGNTAYYRDGDFDHCAGGIYVDGGQNIEIYGNTVQCCDIGIEVATEHSPDDDPLFRVTGVRVHHNVIADCHGFAGLCFGGYARRLGFTEECEFDHNTLIGSAVQIAVQRSRNNRIHDNVLLGGGIAVLYNEDCAPEDLVNRFSDNTCICARDPGGWREEFGQILTDLWDLDLRKWDKREEAH